MDTKLVYGAALLVLTAFAAASNDGISASLSPVSTPVTVATVASKPKRGVVDVGPKSWTSQGTKLTNPGSSSAGINQNVDSYAPQSSGVSSNPASYSPSKNYESTSGNSGYIIQPTTSYSASQSFVNANDGNYGNTGQPIFGTTSPSFNSNGGQKLALNSLQNSGAIVNQGQQNSGGYSAFYIPQTKSSNTPNFVYQNAQQSTTGVPRSSSSQGSQQIQNRPISAPYYASFSNSPSPLKYYAEKSPSDVQGQQNSAQKSYAQEQLQPTSYVVSNLGDSYPFQQTAGLNQGFSFIPQQNPIFSATSQSQRNALKNSNYPKNQGGISSEFSQMYAPYHQSASSFIPNVQAAGLGPATVDFNGGKIPLPVLQLQSAESFPEFAQALQNQPFVLESNSPYEVQPDFKFLTEFSKNLNLQQPGNLLPFLNPQQQQQSGQPQVLPVRSANGSPQFPQFKGASLNTFPGPVFNQGVPAGVYEPLTAQPQLHFNRKPVAVPAALSPTATPSIIHHPSLANTRPSSENRDDVEIIKKKKKPAPPPAHDFDEDDVDEGYKAIEREYGRSQDEDEDERGGKNYKESDSESDFKPSKSFPFKLYDEKFSKYSKPSSSSSSPSSSDEDSDDDRPSSRYHHQSSAEDEDDYDGHSSSHHADYRSPKARPSRYEDGEEESQRYERQEEAEGNEEQERKPAAFNSYGADFEQEFEDGYRRELPKNKYVHRKEVPEIDEPSSKSSYSSSQGKKGYHQSHDEEPAESAGHTSQKYRKVPKNGDSEGYGSHIRSYNKSPRVVHEESYNYKKPDGEGYSKYAKNPSGDSYSTVKKSPKTDSYLQASRSSYKSPKNDKAYEKGDSYSYSTGSSWKSDKKSPETGDHYGHASTAVKTLAQPTNSKIFNFSPGVSQGNFIRDLTGI